jgi:RNA polymerase sigma-70 factor (ECF subfamily)
MSELSPNSCGVEPSHSGAGSLPAEYWDDIKKNNLPDKLFNTVYYLTHNYHDAQDICQEAFLAGFKNIPNFRGESSFSTYLYKIALNACSKYQHKKKYNPLPQSDGDICLQDKSADALPPYERTLNADRVKAIKSALDTLPSGQKEVVVLKDIEGLTYQEISQALDMSIQTVRTNLARGRESLKAALKDLV